MILSTSNKNFTVPGKNMTVSLSFSLDRKDLSGGTSGTDTANTGTKPQKLSVSLIIPKENKEDLRSLSAVMKAVETNGDPVIYEIVDELANTMDMRKVRFSGSPKVKESSGVIAWDVSFTLEEVQSIAEKKEEREEQKEVAVISPAGEKLSAKDLGNTKLKQLIGAGTKAGL